MADKIPEPSAYNPKTEDWQKLLAKVTKQMGGVQLVSISEMDTLNEPVVLAGSRFELNGTYFESALDEQIIGWDDIINNVVCYIYAVPNNPDDPMDALYRYSRNAPEYQPAKGGWFYGANKALFRVYKDSAGRYSNKQEMTKPMVIPIYESDPVNPIPGQIWLLR